MNEQNALSGQHWPVAALYVVATPIGNLSDLSARGVHTLRLCELIAAEDTRHTSVLLQHYGISKPLLSCHEHNELDAAQRVIAQLQTGARVAYVSDAGTPGISDPGVRLVQAVRAAGLEVVPIPGVSAVTTALSVAGLSGQGFYFEGFLPAKSAARRQRLQSLAHLTVPLVLYEAPHRIVACVKELAEVLGAARKVFVARELTKRFEACRLLSLAEAASWLADSPERTKGEFVLVVEACAENTQTDGAASAAHDKILTPLLAALPTKQAVQLAAEITGVPRNALYARALLLKNSTQENFHKPTYHEPT